MSEPPGTPTPAKSRAARRGTRWLEKEKTGEDRAWRALKRFTATFAVFAGLVTAYIATTNFGIQPAYWIVIGAATLAGLGPPLFNRVIEVTNRVRAYPGLVKRIGEAEDRARKLQQLNSLTTDRYDEGREEGIIEARAISLGEALKSVPVLRETASRDGTALLIAEYTEDAPLTLEYRFDVVTVTGRTKKGAVQVVDVDTTLTTATLICVDRIAEEFWSKLDIRATHDFTPPGEVMLAPYSGSTTAHGTPAGGI